jgi:hypothetical protein
MEGVTVRELWLRFFYIESSLVDVEAGQLSHNISGFLAIARSFIIISE